MGVQIYDESTPFIANRNWVSADGTTWYQLWAQSYANIRIDFLPIISTSVSAHIVRFKVSDGGTDVHLGALSVPANTGMGTVANLDAMLTMQSTIIGGLIVPKGWILWAALPVALAAGEELTIGVFGGII